MKTPAGENLKPRSQYADEAVQLAVQGQWEEAVDLNRVILDNYGPEEQALNRLGKALTELGRLEEAKQAYVESLGLNPLNPVAQKNAQKLDLLLQSKEAVKAGLAKVDLNLFVEEMGKTTITALEGVPAEVGTKVAPGDVADLKIEGDTIGVETLRGVRVGVVEPKLARRLITFMKGGNKYQAGITAVDNGTVRLIIRETYQDPSFVGKPSFPMRARRSGTPEFRPYAKESLLSREVEIFTGEDEDEVLPAGRAVDDEDLEEGLHEVEDDGDPIDFSDDAGEEEIEEEDEDDE